VTNVNRYIFRITKFQRDILTLAAPFLCSIVAMGYSNPYESWFDVYVCVCVCVCVCVRIYVCSYSQFLTDCVNSRTASTHHSVTCTQNIFIPWVRHIIKLYVFTFVCSHKSREENSEIRPRPTGFSTFIIPEPQHYSGFELRATGLGT